MRNIFDQYEQPENRLSHALAVSLNEDRGLLRSFLSWTGITPPAHPRRLMIVEQSLPGDPPSAELEEEQNDSLPDIVIHDDDRWCLLVESKVEAPLNEDQLRRHERTLRRRGFDKVHCLALTKVDARVSRGVLAATWSGLYERLGADQPHSDWSERLRAYLRVAEVRLARRVPLTEGTLTMFDGFPFSETNPYTYGEAKRLLNLAMAELRKRDRLRELGADLKRSGRPSITGRQARHVWDVLPLRNRPKGSDFTGYPHLTLGVHDDRLTVAITIPSKVDRAVRARFAALGQRGLAGINDRILRSARRLLRAGASVEAIAMQRHFISRRSKPIEDASLKFKLETTSARQNGLVKHQPQWLALYAELPRQRGSNIQFQYRVNLPWGMKGLNTRASLELIVESWSSMKPLLDALRV